MDEPHAIGMPLEDGHGVLSALHEPVDIELELHKCRISMLHKVGETITALHRPKLVAVIMEHHLHTARLSMLSHPIEEIRCVAKSLQCRPLLFRQHGTTEILQAKLLCESQFVFQADVVEVASDRGDTSVCHHRSEEHTSELQSPMYLVCRLLLE